MANMKRGDGRPLDLKQGRAALTHGSGGRAMAQLISELFARHLGNEYLGQGNDGAVLPATMSRVSLHAGLRQCGDARVYIRDGRTMMLRCGIAALALLLCATAHADAPPVPGSAAPDFRLPCANGKEYRLADRRGKWLVLYFYPKDDTPGCTTEAVAFRDRQKQFAALKAQVVGVSVDDGASHQAFADKHKLPFTLLTDREGKVAKSYGALSDFGIIRFAKRHTFLIDPDGRVAKAYLKVEAERHADEVIADLKALR